MTEETRPEATGGDPFGAIDAKLNVFALANGMDLGQGPGFRRLEWFTEGLERGILIEPHGHGTLRVEVVSWSTGSDEIGARAPIGDGLSADELMAILESAIEKANDL